MLVLRLYVAGTGPNSRRALANARRFCSALPQPYSLEIVDVLEAPQQALADGVQLTPALVRLAPAPPTMLVGDLSDLPEAWALDPAAVAASLHGAG